MAHNRSDQPSVDFLCHLKWHTTLSAHRSVDFGWPLDCTFLIFSSYVGESKISLPTELLIAQRSRHLSFWFPNLDSHCCTTYPMQRILKKIKEGRKKKRRFWLATISSIICIASESWSFFLNFLRSLRSCLGWVKKSSWFFGWWFLLKSLVEFGKSFFLEEKYMALTPESS